LLSQGATLKIAILPTLLLALIATSAAPSGQDAPGKQAFAKMKTLVGKWKGTMGSGKDAMPASVEYKLTGSGTALVETLGPGSPFEMVSVFHMDGDSLVMTHYCGAGNQPFMKFQPGKNPNVVFFDFVRGSNMKPTDMHMHRVTFTFDGRDHVMADWQTFQGGKPGESAKFNFRRVK
jgi:hypothetical protein